MLRSPKSQTSRDFGAEARSEALEGLGRAQTSGSSGGHRGQPQASMASGIPMDALQELHLGFVLSCSGIRFFLNLE